MAVSVASTHTWQLEQLSADTSPSTTNTTNNPTTGTGRSRSSSNPTTLRMESAPTSSTSRAVADPSSDPSNGPSGIPSPQVGLSAGPGQLYHSSATNPFQPQPSPNQQQQQWTPSPNAAPFYPQFTPFFHPAATPPVVPQPHQAYFDPNQQIAWAYQQMMIQQAAIAQQHHQNQFNQAMAEFGRTRANSGGPQGASGPATPNDFFPPPPGPHQNPLIPGFPFNAGTPPAHPYNGSPQQSFRGRGTPRSNTFDNQDWNRLTAQGLPIPYARPEAAGSSHSINSSNGSTTGGGGGGASSRTRTNSNNTNKSQTPPSSLRGHGHMHSYGGGQNAPSRGHTVPQLTTDFERPRQQGQQSARQGSSGPPSPAVTRTQPHQRTVSNTSDRTASSTRGQSASSSPTVATSSNNSIMGGSVASTAASTAGQPSSSSANGSPNLSPISRTNQRGPAKPSPLSQQQTFAEAAAGANNSTNAKRAKRLSKDDSELLPPTTVANALSARQSGLKGRFKRALAFNPPQALDESADGASSIGHGDISPNGSASGALHVSGGDGGDISSPVTPVNSGDNVRSKPKSRLFSGKFNASTDNISLSSTVSSASVMIRKLGSIGKLARRNTLTNITGIFKGDKNKDKEGKKSKKGDKLEPSVSHATVEVDRGEDELSLAGLSPAARVARQHTLKSNAEAARRLREQAAATSAAAAAAAMTGSSAPSALPDAWEKNTTNNHSRRPEASTSSGRGVSEDGTLREDRSDDGSGEGGYDPQYDPDATIRMNTGVDLEEDDEDEPWAVGLRRSIEKTRTPGKPVIKNHVGYIQEHHLDPPNQPFAARIRSNSYQTVAESQPGPLAHLPSPDPDHIDGLQRSSSTHNTPEKKSFSLPAFSFEFGDAIDILPKEDGEGETDSPAEQQQEPLSSAAASGSAGASGTGALANAADKGPTFAYTHPTANSSAPALSTMFNPNNKNAGAANATGGSHLTGLKKHITFAATLSIYDTFSSSAYDRRSEPSTANRLTPALAQRIKEELNSYKMEEMEVHSASKIHTHFFV